MNCSIRNFTILGVIWTLWNPSEGLSEELSDAEPLDQMIVVATGGNSVQRRFGRTLEVLQDSVLVLMSGKKVDMKGRSDEEIAIAVMEARFEDPALRKGELLLYRQRHDEEGIFIGGAVTSPQFIPFVKGLRLEDAISAAGGRTPQADDQIVIIRSDGQKFSRVYPLADWKNTLLFSRDRIIVFYKENE